MIDLDLDLVHFFYSSYRTGKISSIKVLRNKKSHFKKQGDWVGYLAISTVIAKIESESYKDIIT